MNRGEQKARSLLPDPNTSKEKRITVQVGRFSYHFELWVDAMGKERNWERKPLPLNLEAPCGHCQDPLKFQAQRNRKEEVRCPSCGGITVFKASGSEPPTFELGPKFGLKSLTNQEVSDIVESEGLDYAIMRYTSGDRFEDLYLRRLWKQGQEILEEISDILEAARKEREKTE